MTNIDCQNYQVIFQEPWSYLNQALRRTDYSQIFVLVDENTEQHCLPLLRKYLDVDCSNIKIEAGENHKTLETCQSIWSALIEQGADRHSCMLNLGGGVIGDMGGFCASTFMRGIDFFQIPTTLLSQVDASVGSKLGIDFQGYKNLVGIFNEPQAVIIDPDFLQTLDPRELRSGYAEVIKHSLIKDKELWNKITSNQDLQSIDFDAIVHRNVEIKKEVVDEDPFEKGLRKILNFGHTIGHAIETQFLQTASPLLHGEAIAIGMICEAWIGKSQQMINEVQFNAIEKYIRSIYTDLPVTIIEHTEVMNSMLKDKKNKGGIIQASILDDIGSCAFNIPLSVELISKSLLAYEHLQAG